MKTKQVGILLAVVIVIFLIITLVGSQYKNPSGTGYMPNPSGGVMCTMEAKQCPDGSYVGRSGPKCEFSACPGSPTSSSKATFNAKIGQAGTGLGVTIKPLEVTEDSRCPVNVQCIQAGTVKVRTEVTIGGKVNNGQTFTLGAGLRIGTKVVTLTKVEPVNYSGTKIQTANYIFTFEVKNM